MIGRWCFDVLLYRFFDLMSLMMPTFLVAFEETLIFRLRIVKERGILIYSRFPTLR